MEVINNKSGNQFNTNLPTHTGESQAKVEPGRQHMPPPLRPGDRGNIQNSLNKMAALASVETLEDSDMAAYLDGSDVQLPEPEKRRSREDYYRLLNGNMAKMLADQAERKDFMNDAMATISGAIASFNQKLKEQALSLLKELASAVGDLEAAQDELTALQNQVQKIQARIGDLQAKLSQLDPDSAEYQQIADELTREENTLLKLEAPLKQAIQNVNDKAAVATELQSQINSLVNSALSSHKQRQMLDTSTIEQVTSEQLRLAHRIIFILQQSIKDRAEEAAKRAEDELKRTEFNVEVMGKQRVEQSKKAEEAYEKAQEAAKKSECMSKVIGFLVSAVSIALTVATGGLASPLSVILIGLTIADMATTAITGKSFIGKALEPLMNHVLMPIMEALGKAADWLFRHSPIGLLLKEVLPENIFENVRNAMQIIGTILAVIAAAYLMKSASSAIGKLDITKAITDAVMKQMHKLMEAISRNIPAIMKNAGSSLSTGLGKVSSKLTVSTNTAKYAPIAEATTEGVRTGNMIQLQISQVNQAKANKASTDARINVEQLEGMREKQDELTEMMQESFKALQEQIQKLSDMLVKMIQQNTQTGQKILMPVKAG